MIMAKYVVSPINKLSKFNEGKNLLEKCIEKVITAVRPGSIVVFHDSMKASPVMLQALPVILSELQNQGYQFKAIPYHVR